MVGQNDLRSVTSFPDRLAKSRVILARRKSGKTVFVQRIFNKLWTENGVTIPFFFDVADTKIWYPNLAIDYYCAFASQYISFLERDKKLVNKPLPLEEIRKYGLANSIELFVRDVDFLLQNKEVGGCHDLMWDIVSHWLLCWLAACGDSQVFCPCSHAPAWEQSQDAPASSGRDAGAWEPEKNVTDCKPRPALEH